MIKVDWKKIKVFESKPFAISAIVVLLLLFAGSIAAGFFSPLLLKPLKAATAICIFIAVAFKVHIESRMLQIYMLLGVLDVAMYSAMLVPLPTALTVLFFVAALVAALLCAGETLAAGIVIPKNTAYDFEEADRSSFFGNKKVLFLSPHEDDDINIYGGVIEQYVKNGSEVKILFSTNGDFHHLGKCRIKEALNVADFYGIDSQNVIFLGYGDGLTNKEGKHIYNCKGDELVKSAAGYTETYGIGTKQPFRKCAYTRDNILADFKAVLNDSKPDVIYCCDYDGHADHRALSLFFEEALGSVLKENTFYTPQVFKGFAYSTAWDGKHDFYSDNIHATRLKNDRPFMSELNAYEWESRVRIPVAKEALSRVMQNTKEYKAMQFYSSQTGTDHIEGVLNSDKVFWQRRTDDLLLDATMRATSGNASRLNEFKLADSNDIKNNLGQPLSSVWIADADDEQKIVAAMLPASHKICSVAIYENPDPECHIVNAELMVGSHSFQTGELKSSGAATIFEFPPIETNMIALKVKSFTGKCSLLKIEAFDTPADNNLRFIKLQNANGDFCYDYIVNKSGKEKFSVYTYPSLSEFDFDVSCDNEGVICKAENGVISVNCPVGEVAKIKVTSKLNPLVYDCVTLRNPDDRERDIISYKQKLEQKIPSFSMQWDYYQGLLRRLGSYKSVKK